MGLVPVGHLKMQLHCLDPAGSTVCLLWEKEALQCVSGVSLGREHVSAVPTEVIEEVSFPCSCFYMLKVNVQTILQVLVLSMGIIRIRGSVNVPELITLTSSRR